MVSWMIFRKSTIFKLRTKNEKPYFSYSHRIFSPELIPEVCVIWKFSLLELDGQIASSSVEHIATRGM